MKPIRALAPLVPAYAAGTALKNFVYDEGLVHPQRLTCPVISVGNLSTGGTGKTPLVRALATLLQECGWSVDVLSRGYGRRDQHTVEAVDPAGAAQHYGDEPLLLARSGLPVFVGRNRYDAGLLAEAHYTASGVQTLLVHLLDDGFQHRKLARAVEIVLLSRSDFSGRLLPAGHLREPLHSLHRVDVCVLREEDRDLVPQAAAAMFAEDTARVWLQRRSVQVEGTSGNLPQRAIAFCGIGNPAQFFADLRASGISLAHTQAFPDHHAYTDRDVDALVERARAVQADAFLTTQKDSLRLEGELRETLETAAPVRIAHLTTTLLEPELCLRQMETLFHRRANVRG
jgi:tetraacyldisaccharide 4'-kinase